MTISDPHPQARPLTAGFPRIGPLMRLAYRELRIAANGTPEQRQALGHPEQLPRPWDPPTCRKPELRREVWDWLDDVVTWLNHEYTWDVNVVIPACWPQHPHLVHDIAVVADQRRRAGLAFTSDALDDWHRYCLPAFLDRVRARVRDHCDDNHQSWPARGRFNRHLLTEQQQARREAFEGDLSRVTPQGDFSATASVRARLGVVDLDSGEIRD